MDPFGMAASLYGATDPFAGGLGGMDPFMGVQMPQIPQAQQFQFDPRQNWQNPLMMAGAALLSSGGRDFGGALGAFGQGLERERAKDLQEHQLDRRNELEQYRMESDVAGKELAGRRWEYGQRKEDDIRSDARRRQDRQQDEATMARRERSKALGEQYGIPRGELESIDAYEVRLEDAARQRDVQTRRQEKQWEWKNKPDGRRVAKPTTTYVDRMQSDSFVPMPDKLPDTATDQERARWNRESDAIKRNSESQGLVPKVQNGKIIGYERKWQDIYDDLEKGMEVSRKRAAGEPVLHSDLSSSDLLTIRQMAAQGMPNEELMATLVRQGMPEEEAVKTIKNSRIGGEGIVQQVMVEEEEEEEEEEIQTPAAWHAMDKAEQKKYLRENDIWVKGGKFFRKKLAELLAPDDYSGRAPGAM